MADHRRIIDPVTGQPMIEIKSDYCQDLPPWPAPRNIGRPIGATSTRERRRRDRAAYQREQKRNRRQTARQRFQQQRQAERNHI